MLDRPNTKQIQYRHALLLPALSLLRFRQALQAQSPLYLYVERHMWLEWERRFCRVTKTRYLDDAI
jgi:hypothetical protein